MDRYIGLDAHLGSCTFAVMGPSGRRIREARVDTDAKALREFVQSIGGRRHVCLEEGMLSEWLYELLEPVADELIVVQPRDSRGAKSDALDAWARAEELRVGAVAHRVFKAPGMFRALREAVRTYDVVLKDRTRVKQRLRALYASRGLQVAGPALYDPCERQPWYARLPSAYQHRAKVLGDELDHLADVFEVAERGVLEQARRCPDVRRLMTAPGLGDIRAATIVGHVVTPHRFRTKRQFWSYCGLGIVMRSSSDWVRDHHGGWQRKKTHHTRGLNSQCNRALKNVFKGAVQTVITMRDQPLQRQFQALVANGAKPNLAKLTIARRLSAIVLAMWKSQEAYDPGKHGTSAATS